MKIELATTEDTSAVFEMFSSYNGEDLDKVGIVLDREILMNTVKKMVEAKCVLVGRDQYGYLFGAVAGLLTPCDFSSDMIFNASLFYIHPDWRAKTVQFIKEVVEVLKRTPATQLVISSPIFSGEAMNRFYHMQGFQKLETHFIKKIERVAA